MFEFSSIRWTYSKESFWDGYQKRPAQDMQSLIRCAIYTLFNRLWNANVYLKEYNQPESALDEQADALKQIQLLKNLLRI